MTTDETMRRAVEAARTAAVYREERAVRSLLGRWVSETEPTLIYGPGRELLGLGRYGSGDVIVPLARAALTTPEAST